jgi:Flp pilus assembly protein TadG
VSWARIRRALSAADNGNAIIEFIFIAVLIMVPLVYFIAAVATVQRSRLAVTQAAREAGRAFATGQSTADGIARAQVAVRLALADQGLRDTAEIRFVALHGNCSSAPISPTLAPGAKFAVCVIRHVDMPGVPSLLSGRGISTVGEYLVRVDDFRTVGQ